MTKPDNRTRAIAEAIVAEALAKHGHNMRFAGATGRMRMNMALTADHSCVKARADHLEPAAGAGGVTGDPV